MDEEKVETQVAEEDLAAFDEDWGEISETVSTEDPQGAAGGVENVPEADEPKDEPEAGKPEESGEGGNSGTAPAEGEAGAEEQGFELTDGNEKRTVSREEVINLAQKGMNYDRIRGAYDGLTQELEALGGMEAVCGFAGTLRALADSSGMTMEQAMDSLSAGIIARRDNVSMDVAKERARAERLQAAGEARRTREAEQKTMADEAQRRRSEDLAAFVKTYPKVEAKDIPAEVWAAVRQGQSLVTAYAIYDAKAARAEVDKLRAEAETARKNQENRAKAAPTGQTAGSADGKRDAFDEGWDID